jgi:hypothetical protein
MIFRIGCAPWNQARHLLRVSSTGSPGSQILKGVAEVGILDIDLGVKTGRLETNADRQQDKRGEHEKRPLLHHQS